MTQFREPIQVQRGASCQPWQRSQPAPCNVSPSVAQIDGEEASFLCISSSCLRQKQNELSWHLACSSVQLAGGGGSTHSIPLTTSLETHTPGLPPPYANEGAISAALLDMYSVCVCVCVCVCTVHCA